MASVEIGDVVQLKSGGPKMVVTYVHDDDTDCACRWFVGSEAKREVFPMTSLMLTTPD